MTAPDEEEMEVDYLLNKLKQIRFKFFHYVGTRMKKCFFKRRYGYIHSHQEKTEEEIIYAKGSEKLHHELNVLTILQTI